MSFKVSIDNFRGLAILLVVFSHLESFRYLGQVGSLPRFIFLDATTWFLFISGYLFSYLERAKFTYKSYIFKKLKYVILPYLVLSLPAIIAGLYFDRERMVGLSSASYALWSLVVGGAVVGPMWFIPMMALFFLLSWALWMSSKTRLIYPLTIVALGISLFSSRPIDDLNPFLSFVHFLGFYLLGMVVALQNKRVEAVSTSNMIWILAGIGLLVFFVSASLWSLDADEPLGFQAGWGRLNVLQVGKLALLVPVFLLFERYMTSPSRFLGYFAKISFGLFFIHGFFMLAFAKMAQHVDLKDPWAAFLVEFSLVMLGSIGAVFLIKLVLGTRSRYVIGC